MASRHRPSNEQRGQTESSTIKRGDLHADIRVWSAEQYHEAVREVEALEDAPEGSPGFRRRHQLMTDIFHYEQHFAQPKFSRGRPPAENED